MSVYQTMVVRDIISEVHEHDLNLCQTQKENHLQRGEKALRTCFKVQLNKAIIKHINMMQKKKGKHVSIISKKTHQ